MVKWDLADPVNDASCPIDCDGAFRPRACRTAQTGRVAFNYPFVLGPPGYPSAALFSLYRREIASFPLQSAARVHTSDAMALLAHNGLDEADAVEKPQLAPIPVLDVGPDFAMETLEREEARAHALIDAATAYVPRAALKGLDVVSRRWLAKQDSIHLGEIDAIARRLGRPGAYFLSVNYEWGCTCRVAPAPDGKSARLVRVLDWHTPGLGRHVIAARVAGKAGPFVTMTWPGYTGVLQAVAPGRFAAALNQAPMRKALGGYYVDWAVSRRRVWRMQHITPAHLLRTVFETAATFADAKAMLSAQPIASPGIFSLAGVSPDETAVIERTETEVRVHEGPHVAANHWHAAGWRGHSRGVDSAGRACRMHTAGTELDAVFPWLNFPILNSCTRLVMVADACTGRLVAQGFEEREPATQPLSL